MKNKILDLLSNEYDINDDIQSRVEHLLECIKDNNIFNNFL